MPISLGFLEWGCPKAGMPKGGDAHITETPGTRGIRRTYLPINSQQDPLEYQENRLEIHNLEQ